MKTVLCSLRVLAAWLFVFLCAYFICLTVLFGITSTFGPNVPLAFAAAFVPLYPAHKISLSVCRKHCTGSRRACICICAGILLALDAAVFFFTRGLMSFPCLSAAFGSILLFCSKP